MCYRSNTYTTVYTVVGHDHAKSCWITASCVVMAKRVFFWAYISIIFINVEILKALNRSCSQFSFTPSNLNEDAFPGSEMKVEISHSLRVRSITQVWKKKSFFQPHGIFLLNFMFFRVLNSIFLHHVQSFFAKKDNSDEKNLYFVTINYVSFFL